MRNAILTLLVFSMLLAACAAPRATQTGAPSIDVAIAVDGTSRTVKAASGSTVGEVLSEAGVSLGELDRVTPSETTFVSDGLNVRIVRVTEEFEIEHAVLPFERQTVINNSLPEGNSQLQSGQNGMREDTYRIVYEDGIEVSRSIVKSQVVQPPTPEIVMVGGQPSYAPVRLTGTLAYISSGNAWLMRESTTARQLLTSTSNLDGRVFSLSPDGKWLLYSTHTDDPRTFNTLWLLATSDPQLKPVNLNTPNVLFGEWSPVDSLTFAYSTGQPSPDDPGYIADNNLILVKLDDKAKVKARTEVRESSCGGQSAWWGTHYSWSPDGLAVAFAQANLVGLITIKNKTCQQLLQFNAYNTYSRSAWIPSVAWAPGGLYLQTVFHEGDGDSPAFDLAAISTDGQRLLRMVPLAGMFANPLPSPALQANGDERPYRIAYLQAVDPENSALSQYRLMLMDRDGSNPALLHASGDAPFNRRQSAAWSPDGAQIALVSGGNLIIVDVDTGKGQQVTGDSATLEPRWTR